MSSAVPSTPVSEPTAPVRPPLGGGDALAAARRVSGRVHSVETFGAADGPGIRYILFLQGCPLRCAYCHNPDSWSKSGGREMTAGEAVADAVRYWRFLRRGGVTLSGGEPLLQPEFCAALLTCCRAAGLHTAVDTAGSVPLSRCQEAVEMADLLLLDVKAPDEEQFRALTRGNLSRTMAVLDRRERMGAPVWIRHVVVPGLTLSDESLHRLGRLLQPYRCVRRVDLLPFHKMGEYKWKSLNLPYTLTDTRTPTPDEMRHARAILAGYGFPPP